MQELQRPDRLVEYFCSVGVSSPLAPLWKDGVSPSSPVYSLCLVYGKDEPPASHSRLDVCYYGEPANVNAGNANVFSPACFLCLSRTRSVQPLNEEDDTSLPVTDIVILYPERGEKCPPGYLPVPVSGGAGGAAAAGRGGPYGRAVQIGYSRADSKRPLLDVVLCEGGGGGASAAAQTTATTTAGAGNGSAPAHTASQPSVSPTGSSSPAIAGTGAVSPQSSLSSTSSLPCKVPPQYSLLKKSVAMGMFHPGLFIATLSAPSSLSSLLLRPALLDRFPMSDLRSSPLPESLPFFCFPEGAQLLHSSAPPPKPAVHTFVLTQPSGLLLYCAAVILWEKVQVEVEKPTVGEGGVAAGGSGSGLGFGSPPKARRASVAAGGVASAIAAGSSYASPLILPASLHISPAPLSAGHHRYAPKALVLCSYHPYYRSFASFLLRLHELSCRPSPLPVERLISNLWETPLPRSSHQSVQLRLPTFPSSPSAASSVPTFTSSITFPRPSASSLPHSDFSYLPLFSSLSVSNILLVLTAALNEKKVVLHSAQHPSCLTVVAEAVRSLLFPLQWTSPFVPVVPALFSGILDAPMPVFVGVDGRYVLHRLTTLDDVCVVDLDADEVRVYGKYAQMSEALTSKVKRELQAAHVEALQRRGGGDKAGEVDAEDSEADTAACRACFLHLFVSLLLNVDEFLLFPSISDDAEPAFDQLFNLPAFLSSQQQKPNRHLLRALCSTQLFSHFIEEKTYSASSSRKLDLLFFDRCCRYEAERLLTEQSRAQDASFLKRFTQQTQPAPPYVVPLPDTADLPAASAAFFPRPQAHSVFPCLDLTRMPQPRPVTLAYLRDAPIDETPAAVASPSLQSVNARSRARHPLPSQQAISVSSPVLYAKSVLRDAYAVWFELYSICLPLHPSPHTALLNVWRGLARMTAQGVEPDVGIYRSVLSICGRWRKREEAMSIFETMRRNGVKPTAVTYGAYTSAMADSANEIEMERERRIDREHEGDAASSAAAGAPAAAAATAGSAATATVSSPRKDVGMPSRSLFLDPFRLAADKHKRLILRAQRQQVRWSSLSMSVTHCCPQCSYEQSEGEVLTSFMIAAAASPSASPACPACRAAFAPTLSVLTSITTHPPRLKACVHRHILGRPLHPLTRRYSISVPLLPSSRLRERFLSASVMFREDMCSVNVMRVMHEVVYWNALYCLSQPHNCWDLTFLVEEAAAAEGRKVRIKRRRKGEEDDADESAAGSRRSKRPMRNRTVRVNEGLRERQQQTESSRVNGARSAVEEDEDDGGRERNGSAVTRRSPSASIASTASSASSLTSTDSGVLSPPIRSRHVSIDESSAASDLLSPPYAQPAATASSASTAPSTTDPQPSPAYLLSHHEADAATERELASLLSRRSMQPAMELFLRHRRKRRAEQDFSDDGSTAAARHSPPVHPASPPPPATSSPAIAASLSPRSLQSAHDAPDASSSPQSLLVKKAKSPLLVRPPSGEMTASSSHPNSFIDSSQPAAAAAASSTQTLSQPQRRPAASTISKSQSWNDGELMKPSPAASIATIALHAIKTGRLDGLSLSPSPSAAPAAAASAATDGIIAQHSVWYPVRDAGPSIPLHRHCMFEAFYTLALRRYDTYAALCEAFNAAVKTLAAPYAEEMTAMDAAPTAVVMVVETVLGVRKEREKKKIKPDKETAAKLQRELSSAGKVKPASAAAARGGMQAEEAREEKGGGGDGVVPTAMARSVTADSQPVTASVRAVSPALSPSPVPMTFPIAYPVSASSASAVPSAQQQQQQHSRSPLPRALSTSYSSPAPSRLAVPSLFSPPSTPFSSVYEQEVYGGSVSDFIGPGGEPSGQTPSRSPGSRPPLAWTREDSIEEQAADDLFASTEDAGIGIVRAAAGSPLMSPPAHQASRESSSSSVGSMGGYRPSRSHSLLSPLATAPASPRSPRLSSLSPEFSPSSPRNGDATSAASPGAHTVLGPGSSADIGPSRMSRSTSQPGDALQQHRHHSTNSIHTPPKGGNSNPPISARSATLSSVASAASSSSHPGQPQANGSAAAAAQSASAASSSSQHKSFGQSLYQFLMTKPTAASAAASGRGSATFTAGSVQQPAARVRPAGSGAGSAVSAAGGAPGVRRKGVSATNLDSSAKQREERDREQKTQRSR